MTAADSIKKLLHTCKILAVVWATTNFVPNCLVWLVNVKIVSSTYKEYIIRITKKIKQRFYAFRVEDKRILEFLWLSTHFGCFARELPIRWINRYKRYLGSRQSLWLIAMGFHFDPITPGIEWGKSPVSSHLIMTELSNMHFPVKCRARFFKVLSFHQLKCLLPPFHQWGVITFF